MDNLQGALEQLKVYANGQTLTARISRREARVLLNERDTLLKANTRFDDLPKELVKDNGIEYIRIPYIAFAKWDVKRHAAIAKASV